MRKGRPKKRNILADAKYKDILVSKFINRMMLHGKKMLATNIFYDALDIVKVKVEGVNELETFKRALDNVTPLVEVRTRRIGGANFPIPQHVRDERKLTLAIRWTINAARKRSEKSFAEKLAAELILAAKLEGAAMKMKTDTHRMAEANKAFSHFKF